MIFHDATPSLQWTLQNAVIEWPVWGKITLFQISVPVERHKQWRTEGANNRSVITAAFQPSIDTQSLQEYRHDIGVVSTVVLVHHLEFYSCTANPNTPGITLESFRIPVGVVQNTKRILKAKFLRIYKSLIPMLSALSTEEGLRCSTPFQIWSKYLHKCILFLSGTNNDVAAQSSDLEGNLKFH